MRRASKLPPGYYVLRIADDAYVVLRVRLNRPLVYDQVTGAYPTRREAARWVYQTVAMAGGEGAVLERRIDVGLRGE